jgi:hypothetical protein
MFDRRNLLRASALTVVGTALAACSIFSSTTTNGVTTVTIDTARVSTDGSAILTAISAVLMAPSIIVLLGPNLLTAQAALAAAQLALSQFTAMTGPSVTLALDTTKAQALIASFAGDVSQILTLVQPLTAKLKGTTATAIGNYVAATMTLLPLVQLAAALSATGATKTSMTEQQALAVATH